MAMSTLTSHRITLLVVCVTALVACGSPDAKLHDDADASLSDDAGAHGTDTTCGNGSGPRGLSSRSLKVGDTTRNYLLYVPQTAKRDQKLPLVFVFHGLFMSGQEMHDITGYTDLADREGLTVVFPEGEAGPMSLSAPWNVGANVCPGMAPNAMGDDLAFVDAIKADVASEQCIDEEHVFASGFSMGGYFTHHLACTRADIRGFAPHSGGTHDLSECTAGHKPIIIFHGDADSIVPDGCDDPDAASIPTGFTPSATAWAKQNGCSTEFDSVEVKGGYCHIYKACPADGQVELCVFSKMNHCWAGGSPNQSFSCPDAESATELQWKFFKQHAWSK